MNVKIIGLRLAATIFGLVAFLHLLRLITDVTVTIDDWLLPMWVNMMGLIGAAVLSIWMFLISSKKEV